MIRTRHIFSLLSLVLLLIAGCNCNNVKNTKNVNVSGIKVEVNISRLEKDMLAVNPDNAPAEMPALLSKYPDFLPYYLGEVMQIGNLKASQEITFNKVGLFLKDTSVHMLLDTVSKAFPNLDFLHAGLEDAFKHYKYYFPNKSTPKVITCITGFNYPSFTYDTTILGISLEMYLGRNFNYPPSIPDYLRIGCTKEYMLANCMKALAGMDHSFEPNDNKLITAMINQGKQLYFTDLMLPNTDDHLKMGYTKKNIEWCKKNEPEIWKFFIDKDLIYSTSATENAHFITPGPNTSGMPQEAPGNIGSWVGWQIVRQYMQQFPETTFDALMKTDAQSILNKSMHKPKHSAI